MKSRAAVAFAPGEPLQIVEIDVAPQKGRGSGSHYSYRRLPHRCVHPFWQ